MLLFHLPSERLSDETFNVALLLKSSMVLSYVPFLLLYTYSVMVWAVVIENIANKPRTNKRMKLAAGAFSFFLQTMASMGNTR